jgi:methyl-accepting chemotaxis protein
LIAGFLALSAVTIVVGVVNLSRQGQLADRASDVALRDLEPLAELRTAEMAITNVSTLDILISDPRNGDKDREAFVAIRKERYDTLQATLPRLRQDTPSELRAEVDKLTALIESYFKVHEQRQQSASDPVRFSELNQQATVLYQQVQDAFNALAGKFVSDGRQQRQAVLDEHRSSRNQNIAVLVFAVALALGFGWWFARKIRRPVEGMVEALGRLADGDLSQQIRVTSSDEFGNMAESLRTALRKVREIVEAATGSAARLQSSAQSVSSASHRLSGLAEETSERAAGASSSGDQISRSVQTVAAGSEEMTIAIGEIARNAQNAAYTGRGAVDAAGTANETIERLGSSSAEIGNVIKLITSIAEQTNLLALNATIEAARAGDAGKGFAVVAGEVKDLAQESAKAADGIAHRIESIQAETGHAIVAIGDVVDLIGKVNEYQTTIASAVEEQVSTSNEMSRSIAQAAAAVTAIGNDITAVSASASSTATEVAETGRAAGELGAMSDDLRAVVGRFTL